MTPSGAYSHAHVAQGTFFHPKDAMHPNRNISGAWTTFVLDKSEGFTQAGVKRLNESLPRPLTSPVTFSLSENTAVCIHTHGLRVWDWTLSMAERHGTPSGQYPGVQQRDPDSRIGHGYRTQPWDKGGRADRLQRR